MTQPETTLAEHVVAYLKQEGFEVYQEVSVFDYGVADIIAVHAGRGASGEVWAVECKSSFGFAVIRQAERWLRHVRRTFIAVPVGGDDLRERTLRWLGIGALYVTERGVVYPATPALHYPNPVDIGILDTLKPEHQTYAKAGNAEGKRFTKFQVMCDAIREYVAQNPGDTIRTVVSQINHPYWSDTFAAQLIKELAKAGSIHGIKARYDGRTYRLEVAEETREVA